MTHPIPFFNHLQQTMVSVFPTLLLYLPFKVFPRAHHPLIQQTHDSFFPYQAVHPLTALFEFTILLLFEWVIQSIPVRFWRFLSKEWTPFFKPMFCNSPTLHFPPTISLCPNVLQDFWSTFFFVPTPWAGPWLPWFMEIEFPHRPAFFFPQPLSRRKREEYPLSPFIHSRTYC